MRRTFLIPFISALLGGALVIAVVAAAGDLGTKKTTVTTVEAPPAAPTNASATAGAGQATISWTAGTNVRWYRVFRSTNPAERGQLIEEKAGVLNAPATSVVDASLPLGQTYYYSVTGIGYGLVVAQELFSVAEVFAWTLILVALLFVAEAVLTQVEERVLRWRA